MESRTSLQQLKDVKFYLENFTKIKGKKPGSLIPFILNEAQKDLFNTVRKNNRVIILKARQIGFSSAMVGYFYHDTIMTPGTTTAIIGYNSELTAELLDKVKVFYRTTPPSLRPTIQYNSKSEITFPQINSKMIILPSTENVGRGYTLSNVLCLSGDTTVYNRNGHPKKIQDLSAGEEILNGMGSYSKVKMVVSRENKEEMVRLSVYGCDSLSLTKDHQVFVRTEDRKGEWKKAGEITKKDFIAYPYFQNRNKIKKIRLKKYVNEKYESRGFKLEEIELTREFGELCGWYLSEGSFNGNQVILSVHKKEVRYLLNLLKYNFSGYFSSWSVGYSKKSETALIHLYGKPLCAWLAEMFGEGCQNKKIDDRLWRWGWEFGYGLLRGIVLGDGCLKNKRSTIIVTTSPSLAYQLKRYMVSLRIALPSVKHKESYRYGKKGKDRYDIFLSGKGNYKLRRKLGFELPVYNNGRARWETENHPGNNQGSGYWMRGRFYYWGKVRKVELIEAEPTVYDIVLENNPHSFVANGMVVHNCTELSSWEKAEDKMMTLEASVPIDGKLVIESTPAGQGNLYHRMWMTDNDYVKKEYGWWWGYTKEQVDIIRRRMNNPAKFAQEYGLEFLASGRSVFESSVIAEQRRNVWKLGETYAQGDLQYKVYEDNRLRIYKPPILGVPYVVGVDVAEGVEGGDFSVATIWNRYTGEEVAMFRGLVPPDRFADLLNVWGRKYNNALMAVEINNHGLTTLTCLKQLLYPSLYFRPKKIDAMSVAASDKFGWKTTKVTRPLMIDEFAQACRGQELMIHSKELLDEMSVFIYDDNGNMKPQSTFHDDEIFSAAIAYQAFKMVSRTALAQIEYEKYLPKSYAY